MLHVKYYENYFFSGTSLGDIYASKRKKLGDHFEAGIWFHSTLTVVIHLRLEAKHAV